MRTATARAPSLPLSQLVGHHGEGGLDGLCADGGAIAREKHSADDLPALACDADEDGADRLLFTAAIRPGVASFFSPLDWGLIMSRPWI